MRMWSSSLPMTPWHSSVRSWILDIFVKYLMNNNNDEEVFITGDIGGYMGLLIGGSVITIFELLDLFIYNSLRKAQKVHGERKVQPDNSVRINVQPAEETGGGENPQ